MATRNLILAAAMILAFPFVNAPAADLPSLDELLKQYKELGLPLPPKDAKLVRYEWWAEEDSNGKTQKKKSYRLAFQIRPRTESEDALLFVGSGEWLAWSHIKPQEVHPEPSAADDVRMSLSQAMLTAAQLHSRGWSKLAQRVLDNSQKNQDGSPRELLCEQAWYYWEEQITKPKIDRTPIAKHLRQIIQLNKKLDTKEHRELLTSLELALVPSKAKPGSVEALIDDLVNFCGDDEWNSAERDPWQPGKRTMAIVSRGFEAIPALIDHVDDPRLTRNLERIGLTGIPYERRTRVGDLVQQILIGLAGSPAASNFTTEAEGSGVDKAKARKWFDQVRKVGEERYLVDHVLDSSHRAPHDAGVNCLQLSLIQVKYPNRLPAVYQRVLDQFPEADPVFGKAIKDSKLPAKEKLDLLARGAKNDNAGQRSAALYVLRDTEKREFDALLPAAVDMLPSDVGQWHGGPPGELLIVRLITDCDNPKVWPAIEKVARRAKVGYRVMVLQELSNASKQESKRRERMKLLASFLDDAAVYDRAENDERNPGFEPSQYAKLEVRNFVAIHLAEMLDIKIEVNPKRTPEEWAKIRQQVQEAFKRELDKAK